MPRSAPQHRPPGYKPRKAWDRPKQTTASRGYGTAWRKVRAIAIRRDNGLCQICLSKGKTTAFQEVDHILPKSKGGTDALDNLQCVCTPCHRHKTAKE